MTDRSEKETERNGEREGHTYRQTDRHIDLIKRETEMNGEGER